MSFLSKLVNAVKIAALFVINNHDAIITVVKDAQKVAADAKAVKDSASK